VKDFRSRVIQRPPTVADVEALLKEGELTKAVRRAHAAGLKVPQQQIDATATEMFRSGRAGELLSLVGTTGLNLPFDTTTLLRRAFETRDYHTFLKQAHRLKVSEGFEREIGQAIGAIEARAPGEAAAWRQKFLARAARLKG
jgi:hypothetical protein